jgi:hypothetical protein
MIIFAYIWVFMIVFCFLSVIFGVIVEKYVPETHPFKKWWRRHIVDRHPE